MLHVSDAEFPSLQEVCFWTAWSIFGAAGLSVEIGSFNPAARRVRGSVFQVHGTRLVLDATSKLWVRLSLSTYALSNSNLFCA